MDKAQVHEYCERQIERNYNEVGVNEGKWIIERYKNYTVHLIKSRNTYNIDLFLWCKRRWKTQNI
jgi:ribosomal silencing factor RsfS